MRRVYCRYFWTAKAIHSDPVKKVVAAVNHKCRLIYTPTKTNSTTPVETLVDNAGLCLLKTVGMRATTKTKEPSVSIKSWIWCTA